MELIQIHPCHIKYFFMLTSNTMVKQMRPILKYIIVLASLIMIASCEREHLEPNDPNDTEPLVYILGKIGNDSIRIAGGLDNYIGSTSVNDTLASERIFFFTLRNPETPGRSYFTFKINNFQHIKSQLQDDLNHTVFPGLKPYQDDHHLSPLVSLGVTIIWFDENQREYSTQALEQGQPFSILSVEDVVFEGKFYKKAIVEFECDLADHAGHILHLTNGRAALLFGIY